MAGGTENGHCLQTLGEFGCQWQVESLLAWAAALGPTCSRMMCAHLHLALHEVGVCQWEKPNHVVPSTLWPSGGLAGMSCTPW